MNDKQKEVAARKLCELVGYDPDELNYWDVVNWKIYLKEINRYLLIEAAIREGRGS